MEFEIFKSDYGYYNLRTKGSRPAEEMVAYLKENGYRWSRNNNCWYPATNEAKQANLHDDFLARFESKFFDGHLSEQEQESFGQTEENSDEKTVQLETLIAELREELRHDKEKIARLENELNAQKNAVPEDVSEQNELPPLTVEQMIESVNGLDVYGNKLEIEESKNQSVEERHRTPKQMQEIREKCSEILQNNTDEEIARNAEYLALLSQYEGGGGLSGEESRTSAEVLNAFYTPHNVIDAVWQLADHYAPSAKTVLEPSSGIGRFAEDRPNNDFTLRELDENSARIAKILHPQANVIQGAFQKQFFDESGRVHNEKTELPKYDLVIGNPPYGAYTGEWKGRGEGKEFDRYEEYFIKKGLDSLKDENSLLAFVVPSGFLNTANDKQKEIIASAGVLVDAYRLPEGTFSTTQVGTDIILMKKFDGEKLNLSVENRNNLSNNKWFKDHPEKILGEVRTRTNRFGKEEEYVAVHEGLTVQDELNKIKESLKVQEIPELKTYHTLKEEELHDLLIQALPADSVKLPVVDYSYQNYDTLFPQGFVETPIETLKMGNNQFQKFNKPDRDYLLAAAYQTLATPSIIFDSISLDSKTGELKPVRVYGKSFYRENADKSRAVESVIIFREENNIVIGTHNKDFSRFVNQIKTADQIIYADKTVSRLCKLANDGLAYVRTEGENAQSLNKNYDENAILSIEDLIAEKRLTSTVVAVGVAPTIQTLRTRASSTALRASTTTVNENVTQEHEAVNEVSADRHVTAEKSSRPKKERWNIAKSKGETMTAEEFSRLYGRDFDEREFPIWKATDWQGNIDLEKLSPPDLRYMEESGNYVQKNHNEWTHKELFVSGDIYAKITEQKKLFEKTGDEIHKSNIEFLESVKKTPLDMSHIHFGVKTTLAEEFMISHIDADGNPVDLNLQESFILWAANESLATQGYRGNIDFATANISREEMGEDVSFYDVVNYIDGKPVKAEPVRGWRTYDMSEEEKASEKAERKKEADLKRQERADTANRLFDRYLHEGLDATTRERLEAEYNRRFNSYIIPDYSKLPLFVDGMSAYKGDSAFKLYDQQIKGISFLCNKGNGLLAYDVGVGKTAAGIVATVNQIQTGRSKRPLIVVPNQVYSKWYTDIRQLFPNIQVNDLYNFNKDSVGKFIDKENPHKLNIPENSISLVTYEALKNITFTDESCENELYEDFASLLSADFDGSSRKNAETSEKIKEIIGSASHVKDASYYFYEECGFDNLTVDEAHNFKNLWVVPRPKNKGESNEYSGIPSGKPSARALKMYGMTQLTQRHNDDRNVFMLTATPFTNSPTEVYSMLSYIGRERLKEAGITSLRSFFDEFAQTKQELGVTSTGNIDTKQVMKNWKELPALQSILTEFIDKVDGEEAGIIRPNKFTHVKPLDMSELQKEMREIDEERMAEIKEGNSAAVIVAMNNMRLSCVAPALANPAMYPGVELPPLSQLVETSPKLKFVCDAIIDMYKENPEKGQFMYVPLGKESHGIIKDYLVAHGIPKDVVEIINGEVNNTPEKKEKITAKFNDEKDRLKIIIGGRNTAEGIDLNGNSFVMYNCSLGWNPSETIQAKGRIWRQGNLQGNVHVVYPVMNDSIDSVLYQKHDEKRSRINELWNYKGDALNVEDINPEDLKLDLIKDPQKRAKLILQEETKETRAELSKVNLKIKDFDDIIERRKQLSFDFDSSKESITYYEGIIEDYKSRNLEVPEWIKMTLKDKKKEYLKSQNARSSLEERLASLGLVTDDDIGTYIRELNAQKHDCEEKIKNVEKELPAIIEKLRAEQLEQKLVEYPISKQREILEADILNNLRPMKEVEYEIKTMRYEAMLSEKLKAEKITPEEFNLYKNAGYEKYERWQNGEIDSLEAEEIGRPFTENPKLDKPVAENSTVAEKVAEKSEFSGEEKSDRHMSVENEKTNAGDSSKNSIANDEGSLFFGFDDEELFAVHSTEKSYFNSANDDYALTERQLTASEQKRDEIILPILNGKETGMYSAFNNFARHGVFDVQGTRIDLKDGAMTLESWQQLQAAMNIYRSKEFETFRYVLIDRKNGEIRDQLAVSSHMPNQCAVSESNNETLKQVISRAEETDSLVVAVHNHPSGNTIESEFDKKFTTRLEKTLTRNDGLNRFAGHIILDHDTYNLYTPEKGWGVKLDWNKVGEKDELLNEKFSLADAHTDTTTELSRVAEKINDKANWSDDFIPVVFSNGENQVTGVKLYDCHFFDQNAQKIRNEFQFSGLQAGAIKAFPVITESLSNRLSVIDTMMLEERMKELVSQHAFTDAALPKSTVVEKYDVKPGLPFFSEHDYRANHPDVSATWETRINPAIFREPIAMRLEKDEKPRLKKAAGMEY